MHILSVSTGRADVGILEPVWREIRKREGWELVSGVFGAHRLSPEWSPVEAIRDERFVYHGSPDSPQRIAKAQADVTTLAAWMFDLYCPDLILVASDRYEALSAVAAAIPFNIPVAHIGGGDETVGSYDNQFRHAITKMAHLHFVAHEKAKMRVLAMGEEEWRVHQTGSPSIDGIRDWAERNGSQEVGQELVVIFHPPTLELDTAEEQAREVGRALARIGHPVKGFIPGHDVLHEKVRLALIDQLGAVECQWLEQEQPSEFYRSLSHAACLVGNSSAGIIEACSFGLPVVNIGSRQDGRITPANVFNVRAKSSDIVGAIMGALSRRFRARCQGLENSYGDGHAAGRIVAVLADLPDKDILLKKRWPK